MFFDLDSDLCLQFLQYMYLEATALLLQLQNGKAVLQRQNSSSSLLLYAQGDLTDYQGREAQDVHLHFHTAPEL